MLGGLYNDILSKTAAAKPLKSVGSFLKSKEFVIGNLACGIADRNFVKNERSCIQYKDTAHILSPFTYLSFGNRSIETYGYDIAEQTKLILEERGTYTGGFGKTLKKAATPTVINYAGKEIVIFACSEKEKEKTSEGQSFELDLKEGNYANFLKYIRDYRNYFPDSIIILSLHLLQQIENVCGCGKAEMKVIEPEDYVKTFCRKCVESGVNIIYGHGLRHLEKVEFIEGSVCMYSLGSLVDDIQSNKPYRTDLGAIAEIQLDRSTNDIIDVNFFPTKRTNYYVDFVEDTTDASAVQKLLDN